MAHGVLTVSSPEQLIQLVMSVSHVRALPHETDRERATRRVLGHLLLKALSVALIG